MAFNLQAIVNAVTYELNDGSPFNMEGLRGGGIVSARRLSERGPLQHGDTDLGVRLQPRTITLSLNFSAASATGLDTARDTLNTIFKPVGETAVNYPVQLRITRDDGGVRQLDCYLTGPADIPLIPLNRPGNLHRAVIQLRAADPLWYDPTQKSAAAEGTSDWWLGLNTIGTANVLDHVADVAAGTVMASFGTVAAGQPWSIAVRLPPHTTPGVKKYAYYVENADGGDADSTSLESLSGSGGVTWRTDGHEYAGGTVMIPATGTSNYFQIATGAAASLYRANTLLVNPPSRGDDGLRDLEAYWMADQVGANPWPETLEFGALYDIGLSTLQRQSLNVSMAGTLTVSGSIDYGGNWLEYPVIRLHGAISDPIITSVVTGEKLDFTGITITAGTYYDIDTRYGFKTVKNEAGENKIAELTDDSDLGTFHLSAAPYATGGVNIISIAGTAVTGGSAVITYYNRYTSF